MLRLRLIGLIAALTLITASAGASGAGIQRCRSNQLHARLGQASVAAGTVRISASFINMSNAPCSLEGYPGMQMYDSAGKPITTSVHRGLSGSTTRVRTIALAPDGRATFSMGFADATGYSGERCPASGRVALTAPNDFRSLIVGWHLQPYGGTVQHLQCGLISVSPVTAG